MSELKVGRPDHLATDVGPVISKEAQDRLEEHIAAMRRRGFPIHQPPLSAECAQGTFIAPTLIEIEKVADLTREVFGPVLHVLRFERDALPGLIADINASGYALTGGVHSRIDATIAFVSDNLSAGNIYVNRNIIGAVVGSQPFGGHSLSGTGPKAGGPLYLKRLLAAAPVDWPPLGAGSPPTVLRDLVAWLDAAGREALARRCEKIAAHSRLGADVDMPGPVGERNRYRLRPRGVALCHAAQEDVAILQLACALASGARSALAGAGGAELFTNLPLALRKQARLADETTPYEVAMTDAEGAELMALLQQVGAREGPIASVHALSHARLDRGEFWPLDFLLNEQAVTINTTAAGGNASLMSIG